MGLRPSKLREWGGESTLYMRNTLWNSDIRIVEILRKCYKCYEKVLIFLRYMLYYGLERIYEVLL